MSSIPPGLPDVDDSPVSFEQDVLPLFRPMDIQCMRGKNVFLADYAYMSAKDGDGKFTNALEVLSYLTGESSPQMPFGGPYWSDDAIDLYKSWIDEGCQA